MAELRTELLRKSTLIRVYSAKMSSLKSVDMNIGMLVVGFEKAGSFFGAF